MLKIPFYKTIPVIFNRCVTRRMFQCCKAKRAQFKCTKLANDSIVFNKLNNIVCSECVSKVKSYSSYRIKAASDIAEGPLTKSQAHELVPRLTEDERQFLLAALQQFESSKVKTEYEGQLAAQRWRSRFGRPSKLPTLGDVDPTGTYCQLPEDWLKQKYAENVPPPNLNQLTNVAVFNAVPFIGFGFLDNAIMIVAGDYIELSLGSVITISTMAAAALGNTISDVMGIGSAWYVELLASKVGLRSPNLSPIQLDMGSSRRFANLGRAIGITIGCLLGMTPLLFIENSADASGDTDSVDKKSA